MNRTEERTNAYAFTKYQSLNLSVYLYFDYTDYKLTSYCIQLAHSFRFCSLSLLFYLSHILYNPPFEYRWCGYSTEIFHRTHGICTSNQRFYYIERLDVKIGIPSNEYLIFVFSHLLAGDSDRSFFIYFFAQFFYFILYFMLIVFFSPQQ